MAVTTDILSDKDSELENSDDDSRFSASKNRLTSVESREVEELQDSGVVLSEDALILLKRASRALVKRKFARRSVVAPLYRQLKSLRSVVPYGTQRKDSCVIRDALGYLEQLKHEIEDLDDGLKISNSRPLQDGLLYTVEVINVNQGLRVHVACPKRPGLMAEMMVVLESSGLVFDDVNASCHNTLTFDASTTQKGADAVDKEAIRRALLRVICKS